MKAGTVNIIAAMISGDYEKLEHVHTCSKCGAKWPHDMKECHWPSPWLCPDCELKQLSGGAS